MVDSEYELPQLISESVATIKRYTGLHELTIIERYRIKVIARDALERLGVVEDPLNEFPPVSETVAIFLEECYACPATTQRDVDFLCDLRVKNWEGGLDRLGQYFRRRQEEAHRP